MRIGMIRFRPVLSSALVLAASAALAAPRPAPPHQSALATLFTATGLRGHWLRLALGSRELAPNKYVSGRFVGAWTLCDTADFAGHCVTARGDVGDLAKLGLVGGVVSLRPGGAAPSAGPPGVKPSLSATADAAPPNDGYYDLSPAPSDPPVPPAQASRAAKVRTYAASASQGVVGEGSVFFAHPQHQGADIVGSTWDRADAFCRDQNLGAALYFDADTDNLRDVLCRRD